jgi:alpha-tubulin suppressor-like RCC1 family protein
MRVLRINSQRLLLLIGGSALFSGCYAVPVLDNPAFANGDDGSDARDLKCAAGFADTANDGCAVDDDGDGVGADGDCNDDDPQSTTTAVDRDCDDVLTSDDCDDRDENLGALADDADCDGTTAADDCDDDNPTSTAKSADNDCDGIETSDDCNDRDPNSTTKAIDNDCDGIPTSDDCDDDDATSPAPEFDVSCDGVMDVTAIAAGGTQTCAVLVDGTARCWGDNGVGQIGNGEFDSTREPSPVAGVSSAIAIAAGGWDPENPNVDEPIGHGCVVLQNGTAKCWGYNSDGQLGAGQQALQDDVHRTPLAVVGLGNVVSISAGTSHTCAVLRDGTARCWGDNLYGQLGDGSRFSRSSPVAVVGLTGVVSISAGYFHTCAVLEDGTAQCWGSGYEGRLGNGEYEQSATPVVVAGLSDVAMIAAGDEHTCAVLNDGTVHCWGSNASGQLGVGSSTYERATPVRVPGVDGALAISAGAFHTCIVRAGGSGTTAHCWGSDQFGQLGNGSSCCGPVTGLTSVASISAGDRHSCAVLEDGTAWCWGSNVSGRLGDSSTTLIQNVAVRVVGF